MLILSHFSRGFLIAASAYRKQARERPGLDFSLAALVSQYEYETHGGVSPDPKLSGYTCGKWILDATIKQMYEDHQNGLITKYELCKGSSAFVRRVVKKWMPVRYYGW